MAEDKPFKEMKVPSLNAVESNAEPNIDQKQPEDTIEDIRQDGRDNGWAWVVVSANFMTQLINFGLLSSLGVYVIEWKKHLTASASQLSWVLSLILGVTYVSGINIINFSLMLPIPFNMVSCSP